MPLQAGPLGPNKMRGKEMIDLKELSKWALMDGKTLTFPGRKVRPMTIRVNTSAPTGFHLVSTCDKTGEVTTQFLANVNGYETIKFICKGSVELVADQKGAQVFCAELQHTHMEPTTTEVYTKIAERRVRNPELELIMHKMNANINKRLQQTEGEFVKQLTEMKKREAELRERLENEHQSQSTGGDAQASAAGSEEGSETPPGNASE